MVKTGSSGSRDLHPLLAGGDAAWQTHVPTFLALIHPHNQTGVSGQVVDGCGNEIYSTLSEISAKAGYAQAFKPVWI